MSAKIRVKLGRCVRLGVLCLAPATTLNLTFTRIGQRFHSDAKVTRLKKLGNTLSVEVSPDSTNSLSAVDALCQGHFPPKSCVFVNMVKTTAEHFSNVAETSRALSEKGFEPVPHLPISRLSTSKDFHSTLKMLTQAGAKQLLLVGGNDLPERLQRDELRYRSVADLLKTEIETIKGFGIQSVALAGLPDSPQWSGWSEEAAMKVLVDKARLVLQAGLQVVVATQFCFNPRHLLRWLRNATSALEELQEDLGVENQVHFRIGVPGPTGLQKLRRIAEICQVPQDFLHPSMFDMVLQDVNMDALECSFHSLGLGQTSRSFTPELRAVLFEKCSGSDGLLGRAELSEVLWQDLQAEVTSVSSVEGRGADSSGRPSSGPSAFVTQEVETSPDGSVSPEDILWTLTTQNNIMVNVYPFGGLLETLAFAKSLREGNTG